MLPYYYFTAVEPPPKLVSLIYDLYDRIRQSLFIYYVEGGWLIKTEDSSTWLADILLEHLGYEYLLNCHYIGLYKPT